MAARKKKPGRPRKVDARDKLLQIRMTEDELRVLAEAANKAGLSVSDYVRLATRAAMVGKKLDLPK